MVDYIKLGSGVEIDDILAKELCDCLEKDGIMWMDDYGGGDGIKIKNAMNSFLMECKDKYKLIDLVASHKIKSNELIEVKSIKSVLRKTIRIIERKYL